MSANGNDSNNNSEIINISTEESSSSSEEDEDVVASSSSSTSDGSTSLVPRTNLDIQTRLSWGKHNINSGRLRELPMIAIDKFYGEDVLKANLFFLTHLHTDHMVGLEFSPFLNRLEQPGVKLYTSSATPLLFPVFDGSGYLGSAEKIQQLIRQEKIVPVDVNEKIELNYVTKNDWEPKKVYVTLIPAGHCPGSVMLLFEYDSERILYTGDFRLSSQEIKHLSACRYENEVEYLNDYPNRKSFENEYKTKLKKITHLYLDTTFCSTKYLSNGSLSTSSSSLVSRDGAIENILPKIKEHLKHKGHLIRLEFSARVSHEYAIVQFNKLLKQKTHVSRELYNIYSEIDSCINSMTLDPKAVIHLCNKHATCLEGKKILTVKFSAMWFTMGNGKSTVRERGSYVNVCYSMHASMKEMGTMISAFDTKLVTPLVLPRDMPRNQIEEVLRSVTKHNFEYKDYEDSPIIEDNEAEAEIQISEVDCHLKTIGFSPPKSIMPAPILSDFLEISSEPDNSSSSQPRKRRKICWNRDRTPPPSKL